MRLRSIPTHSSPFLLLLILVLCLWAHGSGVIAGDAAGTGTGTVVKSHDTLITTLLILVAIILGWDI